MLADTIKHFLPKKIKDKLVSFRTAQKREKIASLPKLSESDFVELFRNKMNLKRGDVVFAHSSANGLNLDFPSYNILNILLEIVGENGTILFPTYPKGTSLDFILSKKVFDVRKTPTYTGLLNEFARRHKNAVRSLHPTKSVVAIGKYAIELTATHHKSIYPYDTTSPYYLINNYNAKIIGIGVKTTYLSCVHCVDDIFRDEYPVNPYLPDVFETDCMNYIGEIIKVKTMVHDLKKINFNLPKFFKKNVLPEICQDFKYKEMDFFLADSTILFKKLSELSKKKITIYKRKYYKSR